MPNSNTPTHLRSKMSQFLDKRIDELEDTITIVEIAAGIGFSHASIISMFRRITPRFPRQDPSACRSAPS